MLYEICTREIYEKFGYKHSETNRIREILVYFLRNLQTSQANNSRILRIKNAKFSGHCFYMNTNMKEDFQICISVTEQKKEVHLINNSIFKLNRTGKLDF